MILVVGATGYLGSEICRRLRANGETVRGLVRPGAKRENEIKDMGVEISHGDLKDPASVERACQGVSSVISTATCIVSRRPGDTFEKVDRDGQLGLVKLAKRSGVQHFVFISVAAGTPSNLTFVRCKRQVEAAIRENGMTWTVLQPGPFMETMFSALAGWDFEKGKVRIVGSGKVPKSLISLHDVAAFAVLAVQRPEMQGRNIPLRGPEALSMLDAVKIFEEVTERSPKVSHAPVAVLKIASVVIRPFNPFLATILTLASGAERPDAVDMTETLAEFPVKLTSVREFAEKLTTEDAVNP